MYGKYDLPLAFTVQTSQKTSGICRVSEHAASPQSTFGPLPAKRPSLQLPKTTVTTNAAGIYCYSQSFVRLGWWLSWEE